MLLEHNIKDLFYCVQITHCFLYLRFMNSKELLAQFKNAIKNTIPSHSVDCVVIGYAEGKLKVLTLKFKNSDLWALPGGFIEIDEHMDAAALRVLEIRTGLQHIFLEQFYTFGKKIRGDNKQMKAVLEKQNMQSDTVVRWLENRFISTGYMALVDANKCTLIPDFLSETCEWKYIDDLPSLILDHGEIIHKAMQHLRNQINYLPIGISLLPEKFTIKELQKVYESILQKPLDRGNFQRKILKLDILIRLEKQKLGKPHKAPYLYKFDLIKYHKLVEKGIGFIS